VTITKNGAGTLQVNGLNAAALAVIDGALALQSNAGTSVIESLAIAGTAAAPTALLDLNDSALVVDHPSDGANSEASIRAQIISGRGGPGFGHAWDGNGISSSAAGTLNAIDPESRSLGYAENATLPLGPYNNFRGQPVDESSILIAFTRTGDANLDGVVNDDDVTIVGASYAPGVPQPSWALGDFDYNGFVDDDDVTLLGAFYDPSAPELSSAAVPEPAGTTLLVLAVAPILAARTLKRLRRCRLPG
jgi:hypothetical protein